jgi:endonuclease/exonuclease/phosphatase (EEP) superfamily protein YafD
MRGLRVAFQLIFGPPVVLLALASALGATAAQWGRTDPRFDILAHFAPLWLAAAAATLAISFLLRGPTRWAAAGLSLAGVLAAGVLIAPELLRSTGPHARADAPGRIEIVQFNVWDENPDPEAVLRWLDRENPDIAVIEENSVRFEAALLRHPRWRVACRGCEVLMLSREPALRAQPVRNPEQPDEVLPVTRAWFRDSRGVFEVVGLHNQWPIDAAPSLRERLVAQSIAAARDPARVIVAGDFNSTPWSFTRRGWDRAYGLPRRDRAIATWPARRPGLPGWLLPPVLPIDHVYAGRAWATVSVRRGPRLSSDHYPLIVTLAPVAPR